MITLRIPPSILWGGAGTELTFNESPRAFAEYSGKMLVVTKHIAYGLGHLIIATAGVAISAAVLFFSLKPVLGLVVSKSSLALNSPLRLELFPLQSAFGLVAGYFGSLQQNAFSRDRSARWVWVIPGIWFMLLFAAWSQSSILRESRWERFFWSSVPESQTMQLVTTLPLFTSIAYALGSYVGRCRVKKE